MDVTQRNTEVSQRSSEDFSAELCVISVDLSVILRTRVSNYFWVEEKEER